jgi:flagellar protein FliS
MTRAVSASSVPRAYRDSSILTASPEQLVVMLYDGARRFLAQARLAMEDGDVPRTHDRLQRAEAIIEELRVTLEPSAGEVAGRLEAIYLFCQRLLGQARVERDPGALDEVSGLLGELREAWAAVACA